MCKIAKEHLENNEVVVILPYYETPTNIEQQLENIEVNTSLHKRGMSLFVLDAVEQLFGSAYDFLRFVKLLDQNVQKSGKKGVFVLIHLDGFSLFGESHSTFKMLEYEQKVAELHLENTTMVCAYHSKRLVTLPKNVMQLMLACHHNKNNNFFA
jgi:hypothetical protein